MNWLLWSTTIIVDQIDNQMAFIEWENQSFSVIPIEWLPVDTQERDVLTLSLKPTLRSNCTLAVSVHPEDRWLDCDPHPPLLLNESPPWESNQPVVWNITHSTHNKMEGKIRLSKKQD